MNFLGSEAISRPTRATGRAALFLALLLGLAGIGWIQAEQNSLIGITVSKDKFIQLLKLLCMLSCLAHVVQWYSDYVSYCGWNVEGRLTADLHWVHNKTKLDSFLEAVSRLNEDKQDWPKVSLNLSELCTQVDELNWSIRSFDRFAKFYIFGWHLLLPLGAAGAAFILSFNA